MDVVTARFAWSPSTVLDTVQWVMSPFPNRRQGQRATNNAQYVRAFDVVAFGEVHSPNFPASALREQFDLVLK